jgi:hypothetical protein
VQQNLCLHIDIHPLESLLFSLHTLETTQQASQDDVQCIRMFTSLFYSTRPRLSPPPSRGPFSNPPGPQRQPLQLNSGRFNIPPECNHPNQYTNNIHNIIAIPANITDPSALYAHIFCFGSSTGEGFGDEGAAEFGVKFIIGGWRDAGCNCEGVDEF